MDGVRLNFLILKHKIDLASHQHGPFVALFFTRAEVQDPVGRLGRPTKDLSRKLAEEMQKVSGALVPCESFMLTAAEGVDRGLNIPSNTSDIPVTAL